jgi:integrase
MSGSDRTPRRVSVERNIYKRPTGVLEVGFRDATGKQRWRKVEGGILAARSLRDELLARKSSGEAVAANPRLRFGDAADRWLTGPVGELRESTQAGYRNAVEQHLRPRYGRCRLDGITADDLASLVREMRDDGKSEATIAVALGVVGRIYRFAARRLGWAGTDPTSLLLTSERPKLSQAKRRPIFTPEQIEQTNAAASEPYRTMFVVAALTGARLSELCGLVWEDVRIDAVEDAEIVFGCQVDRKGRRRPTKTDGSARTVPIPAELAIVLSRLKAAARDPGSDAFVFATRTGRPLGQRNVARALRRAQERAVDSEGEATFPILHQLDADGKLLPVPPGALPSMHCFRHTLASRALLAGESVDEIAFLLGHRDATVTRVVYVREVADARRRAMRRSQMTEQYAGTLTIALGDKSDQPAASGRSNGREVEPESDGGAG